MSILYVYLQGLMYDVLLELSILSLELQKHSTSLSKADFLIKRTIRVLETFKTNPGEMTLAAMNSVQNGVHENVVLVAYAKIVAINRSEFLTSLVDKLEIRLNSEQTEMQLLNDIKAVEIEKLKKSSLCQGEIEAKRLCRRFFIDETDVIIGIRNICESEDNNALDIPEGLKSLTKAINTLPCSTAEAEFDLV